MGAVGSGAQESGRDPACPGESLLLPLTVLKVRVTVRAGTGAFPGWHLPHRACYRGRGRGEGPASG